MIVVFILLSFNDSLGYFSLRNKTINIIDNDFPFYHSNDFDFYKDKVVWINSNKESNISQIDYHLKYCDLNSGEIKTIEKSSNILSTPVIYGNTLVYFNGSSENMLQKIIID